MGYVDIQWLKKFGHHSSSRKVTKIFWSPTEDCIVFDWKFSITNWPIDPLATKGDRNWLTNGDLTYFNCQLYNGPMAMKPFFGH
jgi:hypothetical protein